MNHSAISEMSAHEQRARSLPLEDINVADIELWQSDSVWPYFARLRRDDPVHLHPAEHHFGGAFWSVTRFEDIVAIDTDHENFSSEPTITLDPLPDAMPLEMFIAMDRPRHDSQRKTVAPSVSPARLAELEGLIRSRVCKTLDELPIGEPFDWVDRVSIELTSLMLATLFDFPLEDRRKLTFWSDIATADPTSPIFTTDDPEAEFMAAMTECAEYFGALWAERAAGEPRGDLISMLAHGEQTKNMTPMEFLGNLVLLIVGGNDTTRNTMSASVHELDRNPAERAKLFANPSLVPGLVAETLRWQTPLAYMRRTAKRDIEFRGKTIRQGDKVAMWYASGNRDETMIDRPEEFLIDRSNVRHHLAFGFGIHRCMGNRLGEMQLRILWEEIMKRFPEVNVIAAERTPSCFVRGFTRLTVKIPRRF